MAAARVDVGVLGAALAMAAGYRKGPSRARSSFVRNATIKKKKSAIRFETQFHAKYGGPKKNNKYMLHQNGPYGSVACR
jgi:hypothetical protein